MNGGFGWQSVAFDVRVDKRRDGATLIEPTRRLADYPGLDRYLRRVLAVPGVRETVNLDHIKRGYYSIKSLNPNGIVPMGPVLDWA